MTTYYVSSSDGNNSNSGLTEELAWATLAKVDTETAGFVTGDIVRFKRGDVFTEPTSGSLDFVGGVTYNAYGTGDRPVLEGLTRNTGWVLDSGSIYSVSMTRAGDAAEMIWEDGVRGTRQTSLVAVTSPRDFFLDDPANTLYYWASDSADPDTHTMHFAHNSSGLQRFRYTGNDGAITDLDFVFGNANAALMVGEFGTTQSGWVFTRVRFRESRHHGFQQFNNAGSSYTFTDCEFQNNALAGLNLAVGVVDTTIDGCTFSGNDLEQDPSAGLHIVGTSNVTVRRSSAYDNKNYGFQIDGGSVDVLVEDCVSYDNAVDHPDAGGFSANGSGTIFRRCLAYGNGVATDQALGGGFNTDLQSDDTTFEYCIAYSNQTHGFGIASGTPTVGHTLYGCVAYNNGTPSSNAPQGAGLFFYGLTNNVDNIDIRNNIFADNHVDANNAYQIYDPSDTLGGATGVTLDNNLYWDSNTHTTFIHYLSIDYATLAAFNAARTPLEDNGIEADPLFEDASNGVFSLQDGSPAIDAGVNLGTSFDDALLTGSVWPGSVLVVQQDNFGSGWEIGAYVRSAVAWLILQRRSGRYNRGRWYN